MCGAYSIQTWLMTIVCARLLAHLLTFISTLDATKFPGLTWVSLTDTIWIFQEHPIQHAPLDNLKDPPLTIPLRPLWTLVHHDPYPLNYFGAYRKFYTLPNTLTPMDPLNTD